MKIFGRPSCRIEPEQESGDLIELQAMPLRWQIAAAAVDDSIVEAFAVSVGR